MFFEMGFSTKEDSGFGQIICYDSVALAFNSMCPLNSKDTAVKDLIPDPGHSFWSIPHPSEKTQPCKNLILKAPGSDKTAILLNIFLQSLYIQILNR